MNSITWQIIDWIWYAILMFLIRIFFKLWGSFFIFIMRFFCKVIEIWTNKNMSFAIILKFDSMKMIKVLRQNNAVQTQYLINLVVASTSFVFLSSSRSRKIHYKMISRTTLKRLFADKQFWSKIKTKNRKLKMMNVFMQCVSRQLKLILRKQLLICFIKRRQNDWFRKIKWMFRKISSSFCAGPACTANWLNTCMIFSVLKFRFEALSSINMTDQRQILLESNFW